MTLVSLMVDKVGDYFAFGVLCIMIDVCAFEHRILMIDLFNLHCCGGLVAKLEATILFVNNFFSQNVVHIYTSKFSAQLTWAVFVHFFFGRKRMQKIGHFWQRKRMRIFPVAILKVAKQSNCPKTTLLLHKTAHKQKNRYLQNFCG